MAHYSNTEMETLKRYYPLKDSCYAHMRYVDIAPIKDVVISVKEVELYFIPNFYGDTCDDAGAILGIALLLHDGTVVINKLLGAGYLDINRVLMSTLKWK